MLTRTEIGNSSSPLPPVDCPLSKRKQDNSICIAQSRIGRNTCLPIKNENCYRKDYVRIKTPSQVLIVPQGRLRTQRSHPIMPAHLQAVSLRVRTCSCCQRLGMSFPIPTAIIYQKGRVSWHKKHPWPRSEIEPKARAITGWTRHSNRCLPATWGPFAGWLRELIQPRSWRGTSSLSHMLRQTHWEGERTELVQQEEK